VLRKGYRMAPMGRLTLNGRFADVEYQKSLDTFARRHHVRLWKQGEDNAWLSAATEDVGFRLRNMHLTHATDPAIDNERNKLLNDVAFTGCLESAALVPRTMADQKESSIKTDGGLAVPALGDDEIPQAGERPDGEHHRLDGDEGAAAQHERDLALRLREGPMRGLRVEVLHGRMKLDERDEAMRALLAYDWSGNVRELENCLERTYAFTSGPLIHTTDLPREVANLPLPDAPNSDGLFNGNRKIIPMAELERQTILSAITELNGDKLQAARLLGIGKTTLYRKLKDYAAHEFQS